MAYHPVMAHQRALRVRSSLGPWPTGRARQYRRDNRSEVGPRVIRSRCIHDTQWQLSARSWPHAHPPDLDPDLDARPAPRAHRGLCRHSRSPPLAAIAAPGDVHDFDSFAGAWDHPAARPPGARRREPRLGRLPGDAVQQPSPRRRGHRRRLYSPTKGWAGVTVRSFDLARRQWSTAITPAGSSRSRTTVRPGNQRDGHFTRADPAAICDGGRPRR
jgi:hypothetical protein